jgi:hypothetical protein
MDPRFFEDFLWNYEVALKGDTKINGEGLEPPQAMPWPTRNA